MAGCGTMPSHVIPESLQKSNESDYEGYRNVLNFGEFLGDAVRTGLAMWKG